METDKHYASSEDRRWVGRMKRGLRPIVFVGLITAVVSIVVCLGAMVIFVVGDFLETRGPSEQTVIKGIPWIPDSAEMVFVKDSHRGTHGEGRTFLCFRCSATDFDHLSNTFPWVPQPLPQETVSLVQSSVSLFDIPQGQAPPIGEPYLKVYQQNEQTVYLGDPVRKTVWYLSVTW
jgi:hypothetical protein